MIIIIIQIINIKCQNKRQQIKNEQISDHDLRINEIIEENRSDLFKIQTDQFYHEEITKITKKLANRNKLAAKNQTRKVI